MVKAIIAADSDLRSQAQETQLSNSGYTTCLNPLHSHPNVPTPGMQLVWARNCPETNGGTVLMTR
ncbi:MAG: hypothetical protein H6652_00190 [Ardenticatenaceae bacterium]|nr:hypothetical protein [Ardenticatenaceae bacterium]